MIIAYFTASICSETLTRVHANEKEDTHYYAFNTLRLILNIFNTRERSRADANKQHAGPQLFFWRPGACCCHNVARQLCTRCYRGHRCPSIDSNVDVKHSSSPCAVAVLLARMHEHPSTQDLPTYISELRYQGYSTMSTDLPTSCRGLDFAMQICKKPHQDKYS